MLGNRLGQLAAKMFVQEKGQRHSASFLIAWYGSTGVKLGVTPPQFFYVEMPPRGFLPVQLRLIVSDVSVNFNLIRKIERKDLLDHIDRKCWVLLVQVGCGHAFVVIADDRIQADAMAGH